MEKLNSLLMNESESTLFLDYYELTSGKANFDHGRNNIVTETYYFRRIPEHLGNYMIAAGLEQAVQFIYNFRLDDGDAEWLRQSSNGEISEEFIDYLKGFKFRGTISAVPEGTVVFPNEPLISITGRSIDVQLFETYLLSVMNFETMVATKASRIAYAAGGRPFLDFGARRAHGRDAAILSSRASYIGGAAGTALVSAAKKLGIPYSGTMPHKFVQERDSELQAFRDYCESFPGNSTLLIDTYDVEKGAQNACIVGKELREKGYDLKGVRIDSGDISASSRKVRRILDGNGFRDTKIVASSDLDEYKVDQLVRDGAPVDVFGIGTRLDTAANYDSITDKGGVSALGGVYKLVEAEEDGRIVPKMKMSGNDKKTLPYRKQVYRRMSGGTMLEDIIDRDGSCYSEEYRPLLVPIVKDGKIVYEFPSIGEIRRYTINQLSSLDKEYKRIGSGEKFRVVIGKQLEEEKERLERSVKCS